MASKPGTIRDGIAAGRLPRNEIDGNFADLHPPLDHHEALVAADRCYFCHDAPCMTACPTSIDIPMFIRQIATTHRVPTSDSLGVPSLDNDPADADWTPESLAQFTQAALQGAFMLAKAKGGPTIAADSIDHLIRYLDLLFRPDAARPTN